MHVYSHVSTGYGLSTRANTARSLIPNLTAHKTSNVTGPVDVIDVISLRRNRTLPKLQATLLTSYYGQFRQ